MEVANARKHAKSNKRLALGALKKKKRLEAQLTQIDGTLTTIEQQRETLESANTNTAVLTTMGAAAKALSAANADMDVDKVHDMMDDITEQQEVAKEISDAISSPVNWGHDIDEDELEAELNELEAEADASEQEALDRELLKVTPTPNVELPDVPTSAEQEKEAAEAKPKKVANKVKEEDDDDMAELAAWAS